MTASSLTIILPAYNEEERMGPALDELFGYLRRHGERGPGRRARGGPAAGRRARPRGRRRQHRPDGRARGGAARGAADDDLGRPCLAVLAVPHGGKGAAVRAGMLAADTDLVIFADADMATPPDQIPLLVAALADHEVALGSRIQPDGSDMRRHASRASDA